MRVASRGIVGAALLLACSVATAAEPVSIWYRTAEGCPTGDAFLARLAAHDVVGRVAQVGDHIDFVVTLGQDQAQASGILERQSARGTVAIRELRAPSCDAVAEALVLTLALALGPAPTADSRAPSAPEQTQAVVQSGETEQPSTIGSPALVEAPGPARDQVAAPSEQRGRSSLEPSVGAQGSVGSLIGASPSFGANAFAGLAYERGLRPSARIAFGVAVANSVVPDVDLRLLVGRLEACPVSMGGTFGVAFCAGLDLGAVHATSRAHGGTTDDAFWSAARGGARLEYAPPGARWGLELEGALMTPLTRYRLMAEQPRRTLAEVRPIAVGLAAGGSLRWP
jgi:hypothetical protein